MAISIDWGTKVISVPKSYLTLIQAFPTEIYDLPLNQFRLDLKTLEASIHGVAYVRTHNHNTEVNLSGITYARVIEIINGYTVTFEDAQYAVNLTGANSNVGDVVNVNQVSVRSQNSAGLTSSQAIEFSSFRSGVTIDEANGYADGTAFPAGTEQLPVKLQSQAKLIADSRGFNKIYAKGDLHITNGVNWTGFEFIGESQNKSLITIDDDAGVYNCEFYDATITGVLDGNSVIERCNITGLDFVEGFIFRCALGPAAIKLGNVVNANIFTCFSTIPGTDTPIIDMNGTGILALRDYNGGIKLINYTGSDSHSIDLSSGNIILDDTITSGTFVIRGVGTLVDTNGSHIHSGTWNGGVTILNTLVNTGNIVEGVWEESTDNAVDGSYGAEVNKISEDTDSLLAGKSTGTTEEGPSIPPPYGSRPKSNR